MYTAISMGAYIHLSGVECDDVVSNMETFPILKRKDEQIGEYRTKPVILEMYDEMKRAVEMGEVYRTWLVPESVDLQVAHKGKGGEWWSYIIKS